jgi:hypothetical protein
MLLVRTLDDDGARASKLSALGLGLGRRPGHVLITTRSKRGPQSFLLAGGRLQGERHAAGVGGLGVDVQLVAAVRR